MGFVLNDWFLCCIQVFPFMHVSVAFATSWILRMICPYSISFCLHYIRRPLSSHKEVYLTQHPSWTKTNMLHNVLALVSLFVVWYMHCSVAYGYNFKYLIYLFHVNKLVSQLQLLSNLMLFPSHIENAAWVMVATLTPFTCRKPRWSVQLARVDIKHVIIQYTHQVYVDSIVLFLIIYEARMNIFRGLLYRTHNG